MLNIMGLSALTIALSLFSGLSHAQREAVKNKAGDATETKTAPPTNTPGGSNYKTPKIAGPENLGSGTAGAGTMDTTDGEAKGKAEKKADAVGQVPTPPGAQAGQGGGGGRRRGQGGPSGPGGDDDSQKIAYDFGLPGPDGKNISLSDYKGKVLLIVNLGRKSSYASQLAGLEKLSDTFKDKGLIVIGVPSDDFGNAEPGTEAEVMKAYADAKVNFLVTQRSSLTGIHQLPLFEYLSKEKSVPEDGLHWNYTKFLIDRKGKVVLRFGSDVSPDSLEMQANLQEVLDGTWKPKKEKPQRGEGSGEDAGPPQF